MRRYILLILAAALVLGLFCSCKNENTTQLTAPEDIPAQYPPLYESYRSLFGMEITEAIEHLGYKADTLERSPMGYLLPEKVNYLGYDFSVYLIPFRTDNKDILITVQYYLELSPLNGAPVIKNTGETLQRMFGYQYANGDIPGDGFRAFDVQKLSHTLNGKEPWSTNMQWLLSRDISALPSMENRDGILLTFRVVYTPGNNAYLTLSCQYDAVGEKVFVK